jgi:hypothetical protein
MRINGPPTFGTVHIHTSGNDFMSGGATRT